MWAGNRNGIIYVLDVGQAKRMEHVKKLQVKRVSFIHCLHRRRHRSVVIALVDGVMVL